ncbi:hypothetical protein IGI04_007867, partial [Brassica rapa subsp. trilocularis]
IISLYYGMDNVRKPVVNPFSSDLPGDDDLLMVIVATNINPKMVGGRLFLNSTSGIHISLDNETNAGEPVGRQRHWSSIGRTTPERRTDSSFACVQCDNAHAVGALRYIVEMDIADDTAEVFLFVLMM